MRVLIAEDEPTSRELLRFSLTQWGYEVAMAEDGAAAWKLFEQQPFPLVISDWMMPGLDGLELIKRIRSAPLTGYVYTILLTARSQKEDLLAGMLAGADDFLTKPFDPDELRVRLRAGERVIHLEETLIAQNRQLLDKNTQMETDLRMAREIQQALLPRHHASFPPHAPPSASTLSFSHRYLPSGAIGGDFFDVLPLSLTEAGVFICDVMGHGVRAALITSMIRALTEELTASAADPAAFLGEINRALAAMLGETDIPMFVSAFYLIVDTATGKTRHADAGHPAPIHIRSDAGEVVPLNGSTESPGTPLGMNAQSVYEVRHGELDIHDRLLLFTDGLYEVPGRDRDIYSERRLLEAVRRRLKLPLPQLFDELLAEVLDFSADRAFHDDVCLVGMEVLRRASMTR